MGLQVLIVGHLRPELGVSGTHEGVPVADLRHPDAVQDALSRLSGERASVIVLCSREEAREARRQLALVEVALPNATFLLEPVDGTPLALAAAAALINDVDGTRDSAQQLATLDALRARSWSAVWLPSVTKLGNPQPTLGQHARSWFGGSGFLAVLGDESRVLVCREQTLPPVEGPPPGGLLMTAATEAPSWVVPSAMTSFRAANRMDYTSWRDPRDAFGTASCVEMLVIPSDLDDLGPLDTAECPGCGNPHARTVCPYCRMVMPTTDDLQGAEA